jgi:hypothetical protein
VRSTHQTFTATYTWWVRGVAIRLALITLAACGLVFLPSTATAGGGLGGKYSGKITHGGPKHRKIVLRVHGQHAKLVKVRVLANCKFQTGERVDEVVGGGSGKIRQGFSHKFFNIHKRDKHFAGGKLKLDVGVDFHGTTMVGIYGAIIDYGNRGSCGDGGYFRAKRH